MRCCARGAQHDRLFRAWIPRVGVGLVGRIGRRAAGRIPVGRGRPSESHEQCLRLALACGAANTQSVGAGVFEPRDVHPLLGLVEVQEIQPARRQGIVTGAARAQPSH